MSRGRPQGTIFVTLAAVLVVAVVLAVALGTLSLSPGDVLRALAGRGDDVTISVVRSLRLPRVALAALVGAALAASGAALQGVLRNALAEPYLLGVSGGAAVGAVLTVAAGLAAVLVPIGAFGGAIVAILIALGVARVAGGRADPRVLLMAGVVVGAFANAVIMVVLSNAPPNILRNATWWMMGSAASAEWSLVSWLAIYVAVGLAWLLARARELDVLALGEEPAAALGVRVERATRTIYVLAALLAAATVAAAGLVGFVGLVVPHVGRALGLRGHRALLAGSALLGASLLVLADLVARIARPPGELPLGAVTALVGVPFFLSRLRAAS